VGSVAEENFKLFLSIYGINQIPHVCHSQARTSAHLRTFNKLL